MTGGVIVGYDGSDRSRDALAFAEALAAAQDAQLIVACVHPYQPGSSAIGEAGFDREVRSGAQRTAESARELLHTPASLAAELDCSKLEAFDRLERIRADLRPFMYARLAPIDGAGRPVAPAFTMVFGAAAPASSSSPNRPPWLEDFEQSQGLTLDQAPVSHDAVSHGDGK